MVTIPVVAAKHETREILAGWLRDVAKETLPAQTISLRPLNRLQRRLRSIDLKEGTSEDLFLSFFLETFIQDVFFNLTGDMRYSVVAETEKQQVFRNVIDRISRLADVLEAPSEKKIAACGELVNVYLQGLRSMDTKLRKDADHV